MTPLVVVHGGVESPDAAETISALTAAASRGYEALLARGSRVAAIEAALNALEDDERFNAGRGSVLNEAGEVETDASIADGRTGRFAGVAALSGSERPISVAAELLRAKDAPALLAGRGASDFASAVGLADGDGRSRQQVAAWERALAGGREQFNRFTGLRASDTVGALAVDSAGHLAAGTSTGGTFFKRRGRVGDSAVFGAGIYADHGIAVICSGEGEEIIELLLASRVATRCVEEGDVRSGVLGGVRELNRRRATGGILALNLRGEVGLAHNAEGFPAVVHDGTPKILVPESPRGVDR